MNSQLIKILIALSIGLSVIIILEWLYADYRQKQLLSEKATMAGLITNDMPTLDLDLNTEDSYADLVNRPLFIVGRKPIPVEPDASQAGQSATVASANFDWQLNGVYTTPKGLMALLTRTIIKTPTDKYRKALKGATIDDWTITEIHPDKIILTQGAQKKDLLLRPSKPKDKNKGEQQQNSTIPPDSQQGNPATPEPTNDVPDNDNNAAQN